MSEAPRASPPAPLPAVPPLRRGTVLLTSLALETLPSVAGVALALLLGALLVLLIGKSPLAVAGSFFRNFTRDDAGEVVFFATVYTFTGLAVAYAFQAGLFNIGGEGQLTAGAFAIAIVGAALPESSPALVAVPICLASCFAAGAAWAAVPAVLRARLSVHEVLTTILMNLIAPSVATFLLNRYRAAHESELREAVHTLPIVPGARLSPLEKLLPGLGESHASTACFLALVTALLVHAIVRFTRGGYELRAVGLNAEAARAAGASVPGVLVKALLVSGGLAALGSVPFVLGFRSYYEQGMLHGAGFTGIAVAVLAGNDPRRVVAAALLMGFLAQAGSVVDGSRPDQVPKEIVQVLQAIVIVAVLVARRIVRVSLARAEARRARAAP
ncbi:ABC transporter permease [bacterium]|nr:ABC transporter permease [bacterium]